MSTVGKQNLDLDRTSLHQANIVLSLFRGITFFFYYCQSMRIQPDTDIDTEPQQKDQKSQ
ncbi:hypothetical protein VIBR0546_16041 [Vibrio brasiliensis LMG 20546]|uniref:Uncharacterized protein n=1 Tax=Vibrio brasiliensis LMG 20546 TaxID=945543 RepID=E8LTL8_9VIBR|nr:hypothetical protein VIBR0546_16041 [Vibrio brasiliensis LMG 20546]